VTVIGLFKTEAIRRRGPWRSLATVAFATLEGVDWFNTRRLLAPTGHISPAEAEQRCFDDPTRPPWPHRSQANQPPVFSTVAILRPRTASREPPGWSSPFAGVGAVCFFACHPEQLTGAVAADPAEQEQGSW
jgi:hypothetical protein